MLTHHNYFNLSGQGNGDILDHKFKFNSRLFTPNNEALITTGEVLSVVGTPFDFNELKSVREVMEQYKDDLHLKIGNGFDHNFVLSKKEEKELSLAATVVDPTNELKMEVWTDQPCIQFYTGNFLNGSVVGKEGKNYPQRSGFCLETQFIPNSVNHSHFASTLLKPGDTYLHVTYYKFFHNK